MATGEITHRWPQLIPGSKVVLFSAFTSMSGVEGATVEAMSLADHRRKTVLRGGIWAYYAPTGHLIYINNGKLFTVAFDPSRLEVHGTPAPVLEDVAYSAAWGWAQLDISRSGTLVYRSSGAGVGLVSVQWLDDSGDARPLYQFLAITCHQRCHRTGVGWR